MIGRATNLLDATPAEANVNPASWPQYPMGEKARPESDRQGHCFPESAEEVGSKILPSGWKKDSRRRAVTDEILMEQNIGVAMRDGVKLMIDIFRSPSSSKGGEETVPTILMFGPYGKTGTGPLQLERLGPCRMGISFASSSGLESFEGMDPVEWIPRGYAIINCDSRGSWMSQGHHWAAPDRQSGIDGYDLIQWIGSQSWSNGKVTMAGNSRLATIQYFVAAEQPPCLACIAPWEGIVDEYRSDVMRGGRPNFAFNDFILDAFIGTNDIKDMRKGSLLPLHQYDDEYWAHIRPDISKIKVPTYMLASYTTGLHAVGSVQVFRDVTITEKWLRFHDSQEWYDIANQKSLDDIQRFYDAYTLTGKKGEQARERWESNTPRVRNCILSFGKARGIMTVSEDYPPPLQETLELFLDSAQKLVEGRSAIKVESGIACYDSVKYRDSAHFDWKCDRDLVLVGMPKIVLHVSPQDHSISGNEMDVVVLVRKLDKLGKPMMHLSIPLEDLQKVAYEVDQAPPQSEQDVEDVQTLKVYGVHGMMRLSHRTVATDKNGNLIELIPGYPHHTHTAADCKEARFKQVESFKQKKPVAFQTGLWPIGMKLKAGEGLRLEVSGNILWAPEFEMLRKLTIQENENKGIHQVHFGSSLNTAGLGLSRIILPVADLALS